MRLRWWKKRPDRECEVVLESTEAHPEEAEKALKEIRAERKKIEERQPFIDELSKALTRHYNENNFSRLFDEAMRRRPH